MADAKRFNAQQIRRRMKEQQQRFGGKTVKDHNQNVLVSHQEDGTEESKPAPPQLAIAISMSEEADDPNTYEHHNRSAFANLELREGGSEDAGNDADASAWAMMEHYDIGDSRSSTRFAVQEGSSESPLLRDGWSFWDKSFTHESGSLQLSPESQDASQSEATPSTITRTTQQIFVPNGVSTEELPSPAKRADLFNLNWNGKSLFPAPPERESQNQDVILWNDDGSQSDVHAGPTPAKLRAHWIEEKEHGQDTESPPVSLLQESLILSDGANNNTTIPSFHTIPSETSSVEVKPEEDEPHDQSSLKAIAAVDEDVNMTQLSKVSFQLSANTTPLQEATRSKVEHPLGQEMAPLPSTDTNAMMLAGKPNQGGNHSNSAHVERTGLLEMHMKEQTCHTNELQLRLKERVEELEMALKATAATPRGTIIQENPLKTLLDRNQTLVKEVRFADSTCVELSAKVSALEAERKILHDQVAFLKDENMKLSREHAMMYKLNQLPHGSAVLRQSVDELKAEISTLANEPQDLIVSMASTLLSDIDTSLDQGIDGAMNDSHQALASQYLAKALQTQTVMHKEHKQNVKQLLELQEELATARSRIVELEKEGVGKTPVVDTKVSKELSRAQEENDFLGRQLGKVQEKLDQTRQDLEEEKKKSSAIDSKWRTQAAGQLRKVELLEDQLDKASQSLFMGDTNNMRPLGRRSSDSQVMIVEQDLVHARASLISFKKEMEILLSSEVHNATGISSSTADAQVVSLVAAALDRMRRQHANLAHQVEQVVVQNCDRLESLSRTVAFLRSSFLFEAESVSTESGDRPANGNPLEFPGIPIRQSEIIDDEVDDDMYSRMEEARGSVSQQPEEDFSSDLDDISRLLSDDSTLESMLKTVASEKSTFLEVDGWKKPLEAAIRECRRVRDRSVALKEELKHAKSTVSQLEMENRRLVLSSSLKDEEKQLVEQALAEAKARIQQLESRVEDAQSEKTKQEEKCVAVENRVQFLEGKNAQLEEYLRDARRIKEDLEERLESSRSQVEETDARYHVARVSLEEREKSIVGLKRTIEEMEARASEAEDLLLHSRCKQEDMRKERSELKIQLVKSETEAQSFKDRLARAAAKSEEQNEAMSKAILSLQEQHNESQKTLRRFASFYNEISAFFDKSDQVHVSNECESSFGIDWSLLDQVAPFIVSTLNHSAENQREIEKNQENIYRLQEDFQRATELGTQYRKQAEDEEKQNKKLFELLRQAELEMERSAKQIREMSSALSKLQQQESEMLSKTQSAEQEREAMRTELAQVRHELKLERQLAQQRGNELSQERLVKHTHEDELRSTIEGLEEKCVRVRHYVKKLTLKCEEWEQSYERQGKSLEKLQTKNSRMREKMSEMAAKYKQLSGHVKSKSRVSAIFRVPCCRICPQSNPDVKKTYFP